MNLIEQAKKVLNNPPKAGFFVDPDFVFPDGITMRQIRAQKERNATSAAAAKRAEAHRLVKAAKSPTEQNSTEILKEHAGIKYTDGFLARQDAREKIAAIGDERGLSEWQRLADIDYPAPPGQEYKREKPGGMLWMFDERNGKQEGYDQNPLPTYDPTFIGDGSEQTHKVDLTTGEIIRVRRYESGSCAVVEKRTWADEYRIRTKVYQAINCLPPEQAGPRYTKRLSLEGARKISDSCRFMALKKGGFSTFLTLTLDTAARCRVEIRENHGPCTELAFNDKTRRYSPAVTRLVGNREIYIPMPWKVLPALMANESGRGAYDQTFQTVQKELSRFWDAAQKMYQRGWLQEHEGLIHSGAPSKIIGWKGDMVATDGMPPKGQPVREKLQYCWVVENPKNEKGQDNPHIHILMRWRVPFRDFQAWAKRLEKMWGQGFAHLEKIKEPECAGAYMAKAAGYMTKGAEDEDGVSTQGIVRGNRYGISAEARAPDWDLVGIYENGLMGTLIRDVYDHFLFSHGNKVQQRNRLKELLEETPKEETRKRQNIGRALEKMRNDLNKNPDIPHRPSKYQLVITGVHKVAEFFTWAKDTTGKVVSNWLPAKDRGTAWSEAEKPEGPYLQEMRRSLWRARADKFKGMCEQYWAALRAGTIPEWADHDDDKTADDFRMGVI